MSLMHDALRGMAPKASTAGYAATLVEPESQVAPQRECCSVLTTLDGLEVGQTFEGTAQFSYAVDVQNAGTPKAWK